MKTITSVQRRGTNRFGLHFCSSILSIMVLLLTACGGSGDASHPKTYTVTTAPAAGGTINPETKTVKWGDTASFTVTPEEGYTIVSVTGCGGSLDGNTYTTGAITADCAVEARFYTGLPLAAVEPYFSSFGANWNDYVPGRSTEEATDAACDAINDTACIHAGEVRVVQTGEPNCTGLTAVDTLGTFNWVCDENTGTARFVSTGLAEGKHLSDLLDFASAGWRPNAVTVYSSGIPVGITPSEVWWNNPIALAGDGATDLMTEGTIYVIGSTTQLTMGYNITAHKVGLVAAPGALIHGPGAGSRVIDANNVNFLWLEGAVDAVSDDRGISLTGTRFSRLDNVSASNANLGLASSGVYLEAAWNNTLSGVTASNNEAKGVWLYNSSNNTITGVTASNNAADGVKLYNSSSNNTLTGVTASNNGNSGIWLDHYSNNNTLTGVTASNDGTVGVSLSYFSNNNTVTGVTVSNNGLVGVGLDYSSNNTLAGVMASNNGNSGNYFQYGIILQFSNNNTLTGVTAVNNLGSGVSFASLSNNNALTGVVTSNNGNYGIYLQDFSDNNTLTGVTTSNNGVRGVWLADSDNNTVTDITASNNGNYGISLQSSSNNRFGGFFQVGSNGVGDCYVDAFNGIATVAFIPGLDDDDAPADVETDTVHAGACVQQGASDFGTAVTGINLAGSFVGKVIVDDFANTSDVGGAADYPADPTSFDWASFDNHYRAWGKDGSAFPAADNQGRWTASGGRIWDWSLRATDNAIREKLALPAGNETLTHAWAGTPATSDNQGCGALVIGSVWNATDSVCESAFLRHAVEIIGDDIGNDNGLCESNESCLYTPNMGSYQGHGALISAGAFTPGSLTDITLLKYEINGY